MAKARGEGNMCSIFCCTTKDTDYKAMTEGFYRTVSRGPDMSRIEKTPSGYMAFHRLCQSRDQFTACLPMADKKADAQFISPSLSLPYIRVSFNQVNINRISAHK